MIKIADVQISETFSDTKCKMIELPIRASLCSSSPLSAAIVLYTTVLLSVQL